MGKIYLLIIIGVVMGGAFLLIKLLDGYFSLNIRDKTVGHGQHGTSRWATGAEIKKTYRHIPFTPEKWRSQAAAGQIPTYNHAGKETALPQGVILGCKGLLKTIAQVDCGDIHCAMIAASGFGKTSFFLYPNLEYACASGMSFLSFDTKGIIASRYAGIASKHYGYKTSVVDLRNPMRSDGYNLLTLINRYMDIALEDPRNLAARAKAEKYAKILSKTIIKPNGSENSFGQNAFFYDAAEGALTALLLLTAELCPKPQRHIVTVHKLALELSAEGTPKGSILFQSLVKLLPAAHKARLFAGSALNAGGSTVLSVMSTLLSKLNEFLDSELEQVLCFDAPIDAETFASTKSAIFLILPEEDTTKNFMATLLVQSLARELFAVADEHGGKLPNRAVFYCDEFGTMPPFDVLSLFSAGRERRLTMIPMLQTNVQLIKNYGKEGAETILDNCQDTIFGGFAPNSRMPEELSKNLGSRTVQSGSVNLGRNTPSQNLQMMGRPLMTADELRNMPLGSYVVAKTGMHPMRTRLKLYTKWGIDMDAPHKQPDHGSRAIDYGSGIELLEAVCRKYGSGEPPMPNDSDAPPAPDGKKHSLRITRSY